MVSMADWYMRGDNDQTRLTRILDVSQDLKVISLFISYYSCNSMSMYIETNVVLNVKLNLSGSIFAAK
jgi:hypothetical protein